MARDPATVPRGVRLRRTLRCGTGPLTRIAWSPRGDRLAGLSRDDRVVVWDTSTGEPVAEPWPAPAETAAFAWVPDGTGIAIGSWSGFWLWHPDTGRREPFPLPGAPSAGALAWSGDGRFLARIANANQLYVWDAKTHRDLTGGQGSHTYGADIHDLAWAPGGAHLALLTRDVTVWRAADGTVFQLGKGRPLTAVAYAPDGSVLVTAAEDGTIQIRHPESTAEILVLESHTSPVESLSFSADGALLASKSTDGMVRVWQCDGWRTLVSFVDHPYLNRPHARVAFHPGHPDTLAVGGGHTRVSIYELDRDLLLREPAEPEHVLYTTAKIVLVGDAGVGKTGLGWRLAHGEFKEHASTHGQQFWVLDQLRHRRADGTECEAVLWDLAGQHVYRSIHAIFLDDVDVALLLFDPSNRQDPLKGVGFWLEQLGSRGRLPPTLLIGARSDRGGGAISREELEQFCQAYGIAGYLSVSALSATGVPELTRQLRTLAPWDRKVPTVTTVTFQRIKEFVLALKARPEGGELLIDPASLRERLTATDAGWAFTDDEMMGAVRHLETHGYVVVLRGSSGDLRILLAPDLLVDVASSIVLEAERHPRDLGAIAETSLLRGEHSLADVGMPELVEAAVVRFVGHNICFREVLGTETLLIFPGLIKQRRPLVEQAPTVDDMSYVVRGRVENVYAALVVQLGYTPSFTRVEQWQNQAQYELGPGEVCGFRLVEDREGEIELVLYYSTTMPAYGKRLFQGLFEQFLHQREVTVAPYPPVVCPRGDRQDRATVVRLAQAGRTSLFCADCGAKVDLPASSGGGTSRSGAVRWEGAMARLRGRYESSLVRVKSYRRDRAAARCHLAHAPNQASWAAALAQDLREAGVLVVDDPDRADTVLAVGSGADATPGRARVLELCRDGDGDSHYDFRDDSRYPIALFDLVLTLYGISWNDPAFAGLRQALSAEHDTAPPRHGAAKVFVSYAHEDEQLRKDLVTSLSVLQRRGVVEVWQDRLIGPGDQWRGEIERAMTSCDLAILLVSPDFLASSFIQEVEVPFLMRRASQGLPVIPVIARPCAWLDEPVLAELQALPRDARPISTYPAENGARDQAWADVVAEIRARLLA